MEAAFFLSEACWAGASGYAKTFVVLLAEFLDTFPVCPEIPIPDSRGGSHMDNAFCAINEKLHVVNETGVDPEFSVDIYISRRNELSPGIGGDYLLE